eukprot:6207094-Pleurochrysis_carterae.AAC.2
MSTVATTYSGDHDGDDGSEGAGNGAGDGGGDGGFDGVDGDDDGNRDDEGNQDDDGDWVSDDGKVEPIINKQKTSAVGGVQISLKPFMRKGPSYLDPNVVGAANGGAAIKLKKKLTPVKRAPRTIGSLISSPGVTADHIADEDSSDKEGSHLTKNQLQEKAKAARKPKAK